MCLALKSEHTLPKIALRNIVVYKFLLKCEDEENYITPYMKANVMIPSTVTSKIDKCFDEIEEGIHSFLYKKDAKEASEKFFRVSGYIKSVTLVKCIIPFGSMYYKGQHTGRISLASNKLKYIEIVND